MDGGKKSSSHEQQRGEKSKSEAVMNLFSIIIEFIQQTIANR